MDLHNFWKISWKIDVEKRGHPVGDYLKQSEALANVEMVAGKEEPRAYIITFVYCV